MFGKNTGDLRVGYVGSALTSEFEVYGDRNATLEAIRAGGRREAVQEPPSDTDMNRVCVNISTRYGIGIFCLKYLK